MRTAIKKVTAVELYCPECNEIITAPSGSYIWDVNELTILVKCNGCAKTYKTPQVR